ncbi:MAG: DUF3127 domain-containing protein [Bacteroidetes bacterium]|jgi:hypothetical protein|nr:DUF3127 domain-containing protein [Bacteroidota bacterium]MBT5529300.1 DUF3127 domain-containing protein [Cytophagia bacterium]MBT3799749.1 DUF3127 domain-containing protein [Bacteroidota bacterium]MBT3935645.1 DUF3127 domain-containing protein [Bacteroidota bacterium]MBT4339136.1 DUF3127 domain-containing protein [Bacteroidota bacterium]
MELKGKLIKLLELQSGEGKNGVWRKQEFIVETTGQYPKKVCFSLWGDKAAQVGGKENADVTVFFDIESREYNNRWYTEAKAWKVEAGAGSSSDYNQETPPDDIDMNQDVSDDELPF